MIGVRCVCGNVHVPGMACDSCGALRVEWGDIVGRLRESFAALVDGLARIFGDVATEAHALVAWERIARRYHTNRKRAKAMRRWARRMRA